MAAEGMVRCIADMDMAAAEGMIRCITDIPAESRVCPDIGHIFSANAVCCQSIINATSNIR